jgi:hypothetical protein
MDMLVHDLVKLMWVLGEPRDIPDQHQIRPARCHSGQHLTTPPRRPGALRNLSDRAHRLHAGPITPVLQLPGLPAELVTAL